MDFFMCSFGTKVGYPQILQNSYGMAQLIEI